MAAFSRTLHYIKAVSNNTKLAHTKNSCFVYPDEAISKFKEVRLPHVAEETKQEPEVMESPKFEETTAEVNQEIQALENLRSTEVMQENACAPGDINHRRITAIETPNNHSDLVLVKFVTRKSTQIYLGEILKNEGKELEVSFLRRCGNSCSL